MDSEGNLDSSRDCVLMKKMTIAHLDTLIPSM